MESNPTLAGQPPLPTGVKLRTRKFSANPASAFVLTHAGEEGEVSHPSTEFRIHWEDREHGLTVLVREREETGRLVAEVSSKDVSQLNKGFLSVALVGTAGRQMIRRTVPLDVPKTNGCGGSADFGTLAEAMKELGSELGIVVFTLV